jgi:hypothetical protein
MLAWHGYRSVFVMPFLNSPAVHHHHRDCSAPGRRDSDARAVPIRHLAIWFLERVGMSWLSDDEDVASMTMTAGPTVFTAEELAALALEEEDDNDTQCRGLRCRATARRSRSLSPSRRSPKLRHTNGRLEPTSSAQVEQPPMTVCLGHGVALHEQQEQLSRMSVSSVTADDATESADSMDLADDEFVFKQGPFPEREDVKRCQSCLETNRRSRLLHIFRRDEGFRQLCAQNTRRIIATAKMSSDSGNNNNKDVEGDSAGVDAAGAAVVCEEAGKPTVLEQKLAMKALKYRRLLKPATNLDEKQLADPSFDVLGYLSSCKS